MINTDDSPKKYKDGIDNGEPNYIKKEDLIIDEFYLCEARNFDIGKWNGNEFEYERFKFFEYFTDTEQHWDDGPPHGTVKPLQKLGTFEEIKKESLPLDEDQLRRIAKLVGV